MITIVLQIQADYPETPLRAFLLHESKGISYKISILIFLDNRFDTGCEYINSQTGEIVQFYMEPWNVV